MRTLERVLYCVECGNEIDGDAYQFSGALACGQCVAAYYGKQAVLLYPGDRQAAEDFIETELAIRRREADRVIRREEERGSRVRRRTEEDAY